MSDVSVSVTFDGGLNLTHSLEFTGGESWMSADDKAATDRTTAARTVDTVVDTLRAALGLKPSEGRTRHCGCAESALCLLGHAADPGNWSVRITADGQAVALPVGEALRHVAEELFRKRHEQILTWASDLSPEQRTVLQDVLTLPVDMPEVELVLSDPPASIPDESAMPWRRGAADDVGLPAVAEKLRSLFTGPIRFATREEAASMRTAAEAREGAARHAKSDDGGPADGV